VGTITFRVVAAVEAAAAAMMVVVVVVKYKFLAVCKVQSYPS
jgi:hypothetical protein